MRRSLFPLILAFFGLTLNTAPKIRFNLFKQIHEIVFHGKGGYDWNTIYNMPIWLRKFTFHEIQQFYQEEKEAHESTTSGNKTVAVDPSGKINTPAFTQASKNFQSPTSKSSTYTTKASKK